MDPDDLPSLEPRPEEAAAAPPEALADAPGEGGPELPAGSLEAEEPVSSHAAPPKPEAPSALPFRLPDRRLLLAAAAVVFLALIGALLLFQARRDVSALQGELRALRAEVRRSQVLRDRGAVLRVRAELQALRQTLPPDLAPEVDKADALMGGIDERLKASP
jgi:hypothetical protein